jgi:hypothetical protein
MMHLEGRMSSYSNRVIKSSKQFMFDACVHFPRFSCKMHSSKMLFPKNIFIYTNRLNARGNLLPKYNVYINRLECKGGSRIGFINEIGTLDKVS